MTHPAFLSLLLGLCACGSANLPAPTTPTSDAPAVEEGPATNAVRPASPPVQAITTWSIRPDDLEGHISSEEVFDAAGRRIRFTGYDYYGSGEVDSQVTSTWDTSGRQVREVKDDTVETKEFDEQGRVVKAAWTRSSDKSGGSEQRSYDDHGQEVEIRYFDAAGTYDFSRTTERRYEGDRMVEEKGWEKYTDGSADLQRYWFQLGYDDQGRLVEKRSLREDGSTIEVERCRYDRRGNLVETLEFEGDSAFPQGKDISVFNEYGEQVKNESFQCSDAETCERWQVTEYTFDEYGHQVRYLLEQEHGDNMGERRVYTYSETPPPVAPTTP